MRSAPGSAARSIDRGPGLGALGWVAALLTLAGLAIALWSRALDRREATLDCAPARS